MKPITYHTILLLAAVSAFTFSCNQMQENNDPAETVTTAGEPVKPLQQKPADKSLLVGDWTRADAPYQIKISELSEDGNIKAGYFNPKPIHVGKAKWFSADGFLKIYIELRDENYPGSNYTLIYYPDKDLLAGKYFQAVESTTYDVGFLRKK